MQSFAVTPVELKSLKPGEVFPYCDPCERPLHTTWNRQMLSANRLPTVRDVKKKQQ